MLPPLRLQLNIIIQNKAFRDLPHINCYLMPETAAWESTYFLRELWLKRSWPQCKHMSERWPTISHYNSLSTHPGSANSCPYNSKKIGEIILSEYSTRSPNKTPQTMGFPLISRWRGRLPSAGEGGPKMGKKWSQHPLRWPNRAGTWGGFVWCCSWKHPAPGPH